MKPAPFGYSRPETTAEALATLADLGPDGKVLAGGQSLLPLLNMRLAAPHHLIDINRLTELSYVRVADGTVAVGALARHAQLLKDAAARQAQPLLASALNLVAHATIRNRGTTVGSIVHADPAGEMTAVLALLGGSVRLASAAGDRTVPASGFFLGPLESDVRPGELATEARFPVLPPAAGTACVEVSRRHGDYAICGVAALVLLGPDRRLSHARIACFSVAPVPLLVDLTAPLAGVPADAAGPAIAAAAALAASQVDPEPDIHATAAYRRHLTGVLTARALREAIEKAQDQEGEKG